MPHANWKLMIAAAGILGFGAIAAGQVAPPTAPPEPRDPSQQAPDYRPVPRLPPLPPDAPAAADSAPMRLWKQGALPFDYWRGGRGEMRLGVEISPTSPPMASQLRLPKDAAGVVVEQVFPGSPAAKAGIQQYDLLLQLDDEDVAGTEQLQKLLSGHKPGESIPLTLLREGKRRTVEVQLSRRPLTPPQPPRRPDAPAQRFDFQPRNPFNYKALPPAPPKARPDLAPYQKYPDLYNRDLERLKAKLRQEADDEAERAFRKYQKQRAQEDNQDDDDAQKPSTVQRV